MSLSRLAKLKVPVLHKNLFKQQKQTCRSIFGIKNLIQQEKPDNFSLWHVMKEDHGTALDLIKKYFLPEHVFVRSRGIDLSDDQALDEYLIGLLKQGNSLFARSQFGDIAGLCVNFASSPVDPRNLQNYAFYRQDPNTKDFLYFTAKMQETPNLWQIFKQPHVFEIKMLTVLPEFRRQGLAVQMAQRSMELANDQGYNVVRMDCINPLDYKIAERCMLHCMVKFPLYKLRGPNAPFIKRNSECNVLARVYVTLRTQPEDGVGDNMALKKLTDYEQLLE